MNKKRVTSPQWAGSLAAGEYQALVAAARKVIQQKGFGYELDEEKGVAVFFDGLLEREALHLEWVWKLKEQSPGKSWETLVESLLERQMQHMDAAKKMLTLPYDEFARHLRMVLTNEINEDTFAGELVPGIYTMPVFLSGSRFYSLSGKDVENFGVDPGDVWAQAARNTILNHAEKAEQAGPQYPPIESILVTAEGDDEVATMILAPRLLFDDWAEFGFLVVIRHTDDLFLMPLQRNMEERHWEQVREALAGAEFHPTPLWRQPDGTRDLGEEQVRAELAALPILGISAIHTLTSSANT